MSGVNKVIVLGNLGQDPELKFMPNGNAVVNISIATSEKWKDKATGQPQEKTEWHRAVCFGKLAEVCGEYLKKGSKVYVEGKLQTRKWQAQDGTDRYSTEIVFNEMQMLDSKQDNQGGGYQPAQPQPLQQPQPQRPQPQPQPAQPHPLGDNFDDDIPF